MARNVDFNFDRTRAPRDNPNMVSPPDGNFLGGINGEQPTLNAPKGAVNYRELGPDLHLDAVRKAGGPRPSDRLNFDK